jgi:hypothetical protein
MRCPARIHIGHKVGTQIDWGAIRVIHAPLFVAVEKFHRNAVDGRIRHGGNAMFMRGRDQIFDGR